MHDLRALAEAAGQVGADDRMAALDLVVDRLAQVVQEPRTLGGNGIQARARDAMTPERSATSSEWFSTFWPYEVR